MNNIGKILSVMLIFTCLFCLTACPVNNEDLDKLAELLANASANYTLKVSTSSEGGFSSSEEYTVSETDGARTVSYKIEKLNGFTVDGDTVTAPEEYRTVSEGTLTGSDAASPRFDLPSFDFSTSSLKNVQVAEVFPLQLSAEISSLESFTGKALSGTGATLSVTYTESAITHITISYTTESGNSCVVEYIFN